MYKILEIDPYLNPYENDINLRMERYKQTKKMLLGAQQNLCSFANGHLYYGFHQTDNGWLYREWAPEADSLWLIGDFNGWNHSSHPLKKLPDGNWEIFIPGKYSLPHKSLIKVLVSSKGRQFDRIPLYIKRIVQDSSTNNSNGQIWQPSDNSESFSWSDSGFCFSSVQPPLIYECHIGMSSEEGKINTYTEFTDQVLPRVKKGGYNIIQLMAVMEHPYYASFGYQVANFYAASSRFGTPEELKRLINTAHSMGIAVLLDLVHSHAATNTLDGINEFDGTDYQFFHAGAAGSHPAWGTKLFNYAKPAVLHFLLSNLKFWMEEYHFDGFRFDGVTSMLYHHHGLGHAFDNYDKYFSMDTDIDAVVYLQLANELIHDLNKSAMTIAEDMSGMPGMCIPIESGGIGFDYRLSMGVPDFWINTVGKTRDEDWDLGKLWHELTTRRPGEKNIGYCESHDQALVGDKTIIFWLADSDMYWHMDLSGNLRIDRAIALHKMIRLISMSLAGEGYMNFMGNEFGHPEWIDFPREGNGNSYHYARRQWSLSENENLKYKYLLAFDHAMIDLAKSGGILGFNYKCKAIEINNDDKLICYNKGDYLFAFNFHMNKPGTIQLNSPKSYQMILNTDDKRFGGFGNSSLEKVNKSGQIINLSPRSAVVLKA